MCIYIYIYYFNIFQQKKKFDFKSFAQYLVIFNSTVNQCLIYCLYPVCNDANIKHCWYYCSCLINIHYYKTHPTAFVLLGSDVLISSEQYSKQRTCVNAGGLWMRCLLIIMTWSTDDPVTFMTGDVLLQRLWLQIRQTKRDYLRTLAIKRFK